MTPDKAKAQTALTEADVEFGHSATYWYALLVTAIRNQETAEGIIRRIIARGFLQAHLNNTEEDGR